MRPRARRALLLVDEPHVAQQPVRRLHRHAAEVGDEVHAVGVAGDVALGALARVLAPEGEHVAAVTAPVGADVGEGFEAVGNAMVDFLLVILDSELAAKSILYVERRTPVFDLEIHLVTTFS